jgi:hypothetical protein
MNKEGYEYKVKRSGRRNVFTELMPDGWYKAKAILIDKTEYQNAITDRIIFQILDEKYFQNEIALNLKFKSFEQKQIDLAYEKVTSLAEALGKNVGDEGTARFLSKHDILEKIIEIRVSSFESTGSDFSKVRKNSIWSFRKIEENKIEGTQEQRKIINNDEDSDIPF